MHMKFLSGQLLTRHHELYVTISMETSRLVFEVENLIIFQFHGAFSKHTQNFGNKKRR
jgi:hypothetical protein